MRLLPDCSRLIRNAERRLRGVTIALFALVAAIPLMSCVVSESVVRDAPLIFAAASLADVAEEVAESYREEHGGEAVRFTFGGSNQAASQIVDGGAPVDAVWFAGWTPMSRLATAGLIAESGVAIVCSNKLVVVASDGESRGTVTATRDLIGSGRVAVPDPEASPAGEYARAALEFDGVWSALAGQAVPTRDVRAALSAVTSGGAKFAVVYETDALTEDVQIVLELEVPEGTAPPTYYAAAVSDSPAAMDFVEYLTSASAEAILEGHGFLVTEMVR